LHGMWPGRGDTAIPLQEEVPAEVWRLASLDGHIFCVEEDQVEVVSLAACHVVARFSGIFLDQICTNTHWVGLSSTLGQLYLDSRNLQGRQLGEPVRLPIKPESFKSLAADGERVFVASSDGKLISVEQGTVKELGSGEKGDLAVISMSVVKAGLALLVRTKDQDVIRLYGFDGKLRKQLPLGFQHGFDHPVLIGDRMYLIDAEKKKLMVCDLKKNEISQSADLPGEDVSAFCGVFHRDQHALLVAIAAKEQAVGKVIVIDPKCGDVRSVCDINDRNIQVIAADARTVIASSTFYQNMIRVFDPLCADLAQRAA